MLKNIRNPLKIKLLLPIILGAATVTILSVFILQRIKTQNTLLIGNTIAKAISQQVRSSRDYYAASILPKGLAAGMTVGLNAATDPNELPMPNILLQLLTARIGEAYPGSTARKFSDFPFKSQIGTPEAELDQFDIDALASFAIDPNKAYSKLEQRDEQLVIRYVTPLIMDADDVAVNNASPNSTKTDWEVGDVRFGLEIVLPLDEPENSLSQGTILITSILLGGFAFVSGITLLIMSRIIYKPLKNISYAVTEVEAGNLTARTTVNNNDEFGILAGKINTMLDMTCKTINDTNTQKEVLQEAVFELLNEVSDVAEGDLTVQANISEGDIGTVASAFNFMIVQLRAIINDVQEATLQVSSSANEIQTTAEHLSIGSESQALQILDTSAAIDEMTVSIQQVSENAVLSAEIGKQARETAEEGAVAVKDTIESMGRIRTQVEDTTKRITRLGESSQRVGEIIELIDDIADRTSILALNAAIEADLAGEAGVSFTVVAAEVESLADRSTQATQQIAILIRNIQNEINEAVTAMESTSLETINGSDLALNAGKRLKEIESVSDQLSDLNNSISLAARQQSRGSANIARSMNEISDFTQQTAAGTKEATTSISNLAMLADELHASVSTFKLPDSNESTRLLEL